MARAVLVHPVISQTDVGANVNIDANASVTVYEADGTTLLQQTMYAGSTGVATLTNPLTANTVGVVTAYVEHAQRCVVSVGGVSYPTEFAVDPAGPRPWFDVTANGIRPTSSAATNQANWATLVASLADGDNVFFPSGTYNFTTTLTITGRSDVSITGASGARIVNGTANTPGLTLTDCNDCIVSGLILQGPNTAAGSAGANEIGVVIANSSTTSTRNVIAECRFEKWGTAGINSVGTKTWVRDCHILGQSPGTIVIQHAGVTITGIDSVISDNIVDGWSNGILPSGAGGGFAVTGNRVILATGADTGCYSGAGKYIAIVGNVFENGNACKIGFNSESATVVGNVCKNANIILDHCYGAVVDGNTVTGGIIATAVDNNDANQYTRSARITNNTVRLAPHGSGTDNAAILCRGRYFSIVGNLIESSFDHGIFLYDTSSGPLSDIVIANNTIRNVSLQTTGTYSGIKLGSGNTEVVTAKIFGNIIKNVSLGTCTGTTTSGTTTVSSLSSNAIFSVGDLITGTNIPAGTYVTAINPAASTLTISASATGSGSGITFTQNGGRQMAYGIDASGAAASTSLEIWGNTVTGNATAATPNNFASAGQIGKVVGLSDLWVQQTTPRLQLGVASDNHEPSVYGFQESFATDTVCLASNDTGGTSSTGTKVTGAHAGARVRVRAGANAGETAIALEAMTTASTTYATGLLLTNDSKIGFLGAAAVARQTLGNAATDPATTQTLANNIRTALINLGLGQT